MSVSSTYFTTGGATLPDVGSAAYNGVTFSTLFHSHVRWDPEQDNAGRTTKWIKGTIELTGVVTLAQGQETTDNVMAILRQKLSQDGGTLQYTGRGFSDVKINMSGGKKDLNWGPKPNLIDFEPLGGGMSANVKWSVTTWVAEITTNGANVLQFNEETAVTYDEDHYTHLSIKGTLEIGLTRSAVGNRGVATTVDQLRQTWMTAVGNTIDLNRFRIARREFRISRDKRVMEWDFEAEELATMDMPVGASTAHGTYRWSQPKMSAGLVQWVCSLRCTYVIRKDMPKRLAWLAFLSLLDFKRKQSALGDGPPIASPAANLQNPNASAAANVNIPGNLPINVRTAIQNYLSRLRTQFAQPPPGDGKNRSIIVGISGEEGMYLDSKTVTFEATWKLTTALSRILLATGFWRWAGQDQANNQDDWAISMSDISGWRSWNANLLDPAGEVIVDFGGGAPPTT